MKNRLLVLDSNLADIGGYGSTTLAVAQMHVPNDVLVLYDEDITDLDDSIEFRNFSSYMVISSNPDYTRTALEKYHITESEQCREDGIDNEEDLKDLINRLYNPSISTYPNLRATTSELSNDWAVVAPQEAVDEPCRVDKCSSIGTTSKSSGRFDRLFK